MNFPISTDKDKLDVIVIHNYISNDTYWGKGRSMEEVQLTIENSLCFGIYDPFGKQIGFARLVTDYVVFAYLMDVIILTAYQGKGLGKKLIQFILEHDSLARVQTFALKTRDAQGLYQQFGFHKVGNSGLWMAKDNCVYL